jgi:MFS family permease
VINQFRSRYRFVVLAVAVGVVFAAIGLARFGYTMLLPYMQTVFHFGKTEGGMLATANLTGYLIFSLAGGIIATRFGVKRVIVVSLVLISLSLVLTAFAWDYTSALCARFLTGLGSGGANVQVMALLSSWFDKRERGFATGAAVSGTSLGLALSGATIPLLVSGERLEGLGAAWIYLGILSGIIALISLFFLKERPRGLERSLPNAAPKRIWVSILELIKTRGFVLFGLAYFLFGFSYIIYTTFFVTFLFKERGFDEKAAGNLWSYLGMASIVSGIVWGTLSDKIGRKRALLLIYCLMAIAFALFGLATAEAGIYISALLYALCAWSVPAVMAAVTGDLVGPARAPLAFGMLTFAFGLGQAFGPAAAGLVSEALTSYAPAFIMAGFGALAGAVLILLNRTDKKTLR